MDENTKKLRSDEINSMVEVEVLQRLPLNTLKNCMLVSKTWSNIIKQPYFFRYHLEKSFLNNHMNLAIFNPTSKTIETYNIDALLPCYGRSPRPYNVTLTKKFNILGSCNGLLCFGHDFIHPGVVNKLLVLNPATRVEKIVHVLPATNYLQILVNDIISRGFGFTCDEKTMDYKLIVIIDREMHVYSLKSKAWSRIEDYSCEYNLWPSSEPDKQLLGVATDNALHWCFGNNTIGFIGVFSLDLTSNKPEKLCFKPPKLFGYPKLITLKGCLHLGLTKYITISDKSYRSPSNMLGLEIWRMEKYGEWEDSWVQLFNVRFDNLTYYASPICFKDGGRKVLLQLMGDRWDKVMRCAWYDVVTKERDSEVLDELPSQFETCLETLVDPNFLLL